MDIWVAEAENGEVYFDNAPTKSDVESLGLCGTIEVFRMECIETHRERLFSVEGDPRVGEPEECCTDCDGAGMPLPPGADLELYSRCGNCHGWFEQV